MMMAGCVKASNGAGNEASTAVTMRGGDDKVCLAIWTAGEYSYSVMTSNGEGLSTTDAGMTVEDMSAIVATVE